MNFHHFLNLPIVGSLTPALTWKQRIEHCRRKRRQKRLNRRLLKLGVADLEQLDKLRLDLEPLETKINFYETLTLARKAMKCAIDIPMKADWWGSVTGDQLTGTAEFKSLHIPILTEVGQRGVRKLIKEERRRTLKWWVEVLVPLLSWIVAILALTQMRCQPITTGADHEPSKPYDDAY